MVSKNQIKLITSLQQKKFRQKSQLFIAEGVKVIQELLQSNFVLEHLYVSEGIFLEIPSEKRTIVTENDLKKITCLSSPNNCLALFQIPTQKNQEISGLTIVLDDIREPLGNEYLYRPNADKYKYK
jgi:TrmH family RNA methyltransferase